MAVIKAVENYAVAQLRKDVRDAMQMAGEQSILLSLYHPGDPDAVPCPQCGDDVYKSAEQDCTICYGTRFNGGVRSATLVWALYTDKEVAEQLGPRGTWQPDQRSVTFEALPLVTEHDVIVRITQWTSLGVPLAMEGYYILQKVARRSYRTGSRPGQYSYDVVSQKAEVMELNPKSEDIAKYPIIGKTFAPYSVLATTQSTPTQNFPARGEFQVP